MAEILHFVQNDRHGISLIATHSPRGEGMGEGNRNNTNKKGRVSLFPFYILFFLQRNQVRFFDESDLSPPPAVGCENSVRRLEALLLNFS